MTDHENAYITANVDALRAAVRHHLGDPTALTDLDHALDRLSGTTNILAHMSGWAAAAKHVNPIPDDATPALLAVDPATGQQINIDDPRIPMEIRLGARMSAALLAEDHDTAVALWHTARTPDAEEQVVLLVLRTMAALIAPNTTVEEARTDD